MQFLDNPLLLKSIMLGFVPRALHQLLFESPNNIRVLCSRATRLYRDCTEIWNISVLLYKLYMHLNDFVWHLCNKFIWISMICNRWPRMGWLLKRPPGVWKSTGLTNFRKGLGTRSSFISGTNLRHLNLLHKGLDYDFQSFACSSNNVSVTDGTLYWRIWLPHNVLLWSMCIYFY